MRRLLVRQITVERHTSCPDDVNWLALRLQIQPEHRFMTRSWYTAWASSYLPSDRWVGPISWLVARDQEDDVLTIIPIAHQHWLGFKVTSLAGYYWPFRAIPMVSDEMRLVPTCRAIADFVTSRRRPRVWRLGPVPSNDRAVNGLLNAFLQRDWLIIEKTLGETHTVPMPTDFRLYEKQLGNHLLKSVAYFERRLRKLGKVEIRSISSSCTKEWLSALHDLQTLEANSWVVTRVDGVTKFIGDKNRRFWEEVAAPSPLSDMLELWMLYLDGKAISYSLNINSPPTKYIVANGYDETFKEHSTGTVLTYYVMRDASRRGMTSVEWGLGDSGYKARWHAHPNIKLVDFVIISRHIIGKLLAKLLLKHGGYSAVTTEKSDAF